MSLRKKIRPLLILFTLLFLGAALLVELVLPHAGIKPRRRSTEELLSVLPKGVKPENYGLRGRALKIQTPDSLQLSALIVESNTDTTLATVVLVHGISACKELDMERAKVLADVGYASLLFDLRAHGQSEGEFCTFGYYEKYDLRAVADTLYKLFPSRTMAIWGVSLGGSVTLQAMAVEPRYQFGIVESTYDEFEKVATEYGADWLFGFRSQWITNRILSKSGKIAHFDPFSVKPVAAAAQINRPILFIHGDKDSRIPMWFGQRNYEACPAPGKRWYQVPGGGHNNLRKIKGDPMQQKVFSFLKKQQGL